jgi:hypothetical protein
LTRRPAVAETFGVLADRSRREGQPASPARAAPAGNAAADPLHAGVLALQAGAGNRAVARSAAGASEQILARKTKEYGLRNKVMRSPFAKAAMAFWHDPANRPTRASSTPGWARPRRPWT